MKTKNKIDWVIISGFFSKIMGTISGPLIAISITSKLSLEEQGYWFVFLSIINIANYTELGIGQVIMHFVAHEWAVFCDENSTDAETINSKKRILSLLKITLKFSWILAILFNCVAIPIGLFVLNGKDNSLIEVNWFYPWLSLSISSSLTIIVGLINSYLEGCQQIFQTNIRRTVELLVRMGSILLGLTFGLNLWALSLGCFLSVFVSVIWIVITFHKSIKFSLEGLWETNEVSWKTEIWPLQWRYACTWVTGIFVFGLINPIIFKLIGPAEAGKYGLSSSLIQIVSGYSNTWIVSKSSHFSKLNALQSYKTLIKEFNQGLLRTILTFTAGIFIIIAVKMTNSNISLFENLQNRLLDLPALIFLAIAQGINLIGLTLTYFARSFKEEPFTIAAWINSGFSIIFIPLGTFNFGIYGAVIGFFLSQFLTLPLVFLIHKKYINRAKLINNEASIIL